MINRVDAIRSSGPISPGGRMISKAITNVPTTAVMRGSSPAALWRGGNRVMVK